MSRKKKGQAPAGSPISHPYGGSQVSIPITFSGGITPTIGYAPNKKPRQVREEFMFGTEPIVGYRVWNVGTASYDSLSGFLGLLADAHDVGAANPYRWALEQTKHQLLLPIGTPGGGPWKPGAPEARCVHGGHLAPKLECECGYWALRDEAQLAPVFSTYKAIAAWGKVKLWGRFCEFEKGYRAQYAAPAEITLLRDDAALAAELEHTYGCPVTVGKPPKAVTEAKPDETAGALAIVACALAAVAFGLILWRQL